MDKIVKLQNNKPLVSTFDLFERMGYKEHRKLKEVINSHIDEFKELGLLPMERQKQTSKTGGRPAESYLLNEDQFILLVVLAKNTPQSVDLKVRVTKEFRRLRNQVANLMAQKSSDDWKHLRKDGKAVYHQKTDVIKDFVDYAVSQGSESAKMYYTSLAKMENKALFIIDQKYPNLRDILNIKQLMQVATADQVVEKALKDGMDQKLHYKDIYVLAKERVQSFASVLGKSQVLELDSSERKKISAQK